MTTALTTDFPVPPSYRRALQRLPATEIVLDWRRLAKREPPIWPGTLHLWTAAEAQLENARLGGDDRFYFGTNSAGLLFAFDRLGRVLVIDVIERDGGIVIADSFEALLTAREPVRRGSRRADP